MWTFLVTTSFTPSLLAGTTRNTCLGCAVKRLIVMGKRSGYGNWCIKTSLGMTQDWIVRKPNRTFVIRRLGNKQIPIFSKNLVLFCGQELLVMNIITSSFMVFQTNMMVGEILAISHLNLTHHLWWTHQHWKYVLLFVSVFLSLIPN